jgi:hypothetical protein
MEPTPRALRLAPEIRDGLGAHRSRRRLPPVRSGRGSVATLPRRFALAQPALVVLDLPHEPLAVDVEAIWHQRADPDAGIRWLIGIIDETLRQKKPQGSHEQHSALPR